MPRRLSRGVNANQSSLKRNDIDLLLSRSIAARLRNSGRYYMRLLEPRIAAYGISIGMWFFLRALWDEDGLGQSELSERAGVMGPTTVSAMERMERMGLIERKISARDRRKMHVHLTRKGRGLKKQLMPVAADVIRIGIKGLSRARLRQFDATLDQVLANLRAAQLK